jgi:thiamine pyrophosphokinase
MALFSFLLLPGYTHIIKPDPTIEGPACGLLPLSGPASDVSTHGLQWDLSHSRLALGEFISSSNRLAAGCDTVTVTTDVPLVWTIELLPGD